MLQHANDNTPQLSPAAIAAAELQKLQALTAALNIAASRLQVARSELVQARQAVAAAEARECDCFQSLASGKPADMAAAVQALKEARQRLHIAQGVESAARVKSQQIAADRSTQVERQYAARRPLYLALASQQLAKVPSEALAALRLAAQLQAIGSKVNPSAALAAIVSLDDPAMPCPHELVNDQIMANMA